MRPDSFRPLAYSLALILLFPALAFPWASNNTTLSTMSVPGSYSSSSSIPASSNSGISFTYTSKVNSIAYSAPVAIPASFQAILNQLSSPLEPTVISGLNAALNLNKQPLEGNAYKDQLIVPLCNILGSGKFSTDTNSLVLENLVFIAGNDRIDSGRKLEMVDPIITFTEKSIESKTYTGSTLEGFHNSLREIFSDSRVPSIEKDKITSKLLNQSSPLWSNNDSTYSILIALEKYLPLEEGTSLKTKGVIIRYDQKMLSSFDADSALVVVDEIVRGLAAATQDSRLDKTTLLSISSSVQDLLDRIGTIMDYSLKLSCLATLDSVAQNKNLDNTPEKDKIINQIISYGVNTQNKTIWEKYGVLVLVKPEVTDLVDEALWQEIDTAIANIPADKRPTIISLQDVMSKGNKQESLSNVGSYDSAISTIDLKVNQALPFKNTYVYHEAGHYLQASAMTRDQISKWDELWLQSDGIEDFVEEYSTTNKDEDYATMMETVLNEYFLPENQKTVLNRAKEQNKANDPTLFNKYLLAEDYWGIESSNTN